MKKLTIIIAIIGSLSALNTSYAFSSNAMKSEVINQDNTLPERPNFSSKDLNKAMEEFEGIIKTYLPAIQSNDEVKSTEFQTKMTEWGMKNNSHLTTMTDGDKQKLQEYMQRIGALITPKSN